MKIVFDDFLPTRFPGQISSARQFRAKVCYVLLASFGFFLALIGTSNGVQAFGLGLVFPGAGFLQYLGGGWLSVLAHLSLFLLSIVVFFLTIVLCWIWNGNVIAPLGVWFFSALGAGLMNHHHNFGAAPLLVVLIIFGLVLTLHKYTNKQRRKRQANLERRKAAVTNISIPVSPIDPESGLREVKELSLEDLQLLRYAYDRALQPVSEWNGFVRKFGGQWQGFGTRYQLVFLSYALSQTNYAALPAMRGYLQQAQLNLLEKSKDPSVWWYWRWERLWGGLSWSPDPISKHNLMFSGYLAKAIGLYQNATGDLRHDEEGAFTFTNANGEKYIYDYLKINKVLTEQYDDNDYFFIDCEPNIRFSICNTIGITSLVAKGAGNSNPQAGWKELLPAFRKEFIEEFTAIDGTIYFGKLSYLGLNLVPPGFPDTFPILLHAAAMSPVLPDVAAFQYEIAKSEIVKQGEDGLELTDIATITAPDIGHKKPGHGWLLPSFLTAAKEQGDTETMEFTEKLIDQYLPTVLSDGIRYYPNESVIAHAKMIEARVATTNGLHDLVNLGSDERWLSGPILTDATYPKVQVAKAVSDGVNLDLVLYPENVSDTQEIEVSQLVSGGKYKVIGSSKNSGSFVADDQGKARISIHIDARTVLRVEQN